MFHILFTNFNFSLALVHFACIRLHREANYSNINNPGKYHSSRDSRNLDVLCQRFFPVEQEEEDRSGAGILYYSILSNCT
jgi:hypothetical protein